MSLRPKILFLILILLSCSPAFSQTAFWTENFENGCGNGCYANGVDNGNGAWITVDEGMYPGSTPNVWFMGCSENGHTNNVCGTGCVAVSGTATGSTLHVGPDNGFQLDGGARYDAGGCGVVFGTFTCTQTLQRAISPVISTVGKFRISVSFDFISYGSGTTDQCEVYYSTDGGASWLLLAAPKSTCCTFAGVGGVVCNNFRQGYWNNYTSPELPAACDDNPLFRISFLWMNNDDGAGTDPSFAGDNLQIRYSSLLPVELLSFTAIPKNKTVELNWTTASEINNDYFIIERSADEINFSEMQRIKGAGNSNRHLSYSTVDNHPARGVNYYRLKQTDFDGKFTYSKITALNLLGENDFAVHKFFYSLDNRSVNLSIVSKLASPLLIDLFDITGRVVAHYNYTLSLNQNDLTIPIAELPSGIYFLRLNNGLTIYDNKIIF